jgi:hypothetical protein
MAETSDMEFDSLQARARDLDFFVGRHKTCDLTRGGDLYLMPRAHGIFDKVKTLRKFQTSDQLWEFFAGIDHAA